MIEGQIYRDKNFDFTRERYTSHNFKILTSFIFQKKTMFYIDNVRYIKTAALWASLTMNGWASLPLDL